MFQDMFVFFHVLYCAWIIGRPYRRESSIKARELYKEYFIRKWWQENRSLKNLEIQANAMRYASEVYQREFAEKIQQDENFMRTVHIMLTMAGLMEDGCVIDDERKRKLCIQALSQVFLIFMILFTLFTIYYCFM